MRRTITALLLALTLILAACRAGERSDPERYGSSRGGDAEWSIDRARLLFSGRRNGTSDLYLLDRGSGSTVRLTEFGTTEGGANAGRVSPDGERVAFQVRRGSDYAVYVMSLAGDTTINLSEHPEYDVSPVWSPDGQRVGFMSTRGHELGGIGPFPGHIYVIDLADRMLHRITARPLTSSLGPSDWSADGKSMLMARVMGEAPAVFLIDVATGSETQITAAQAGEYSAVFSHTGDRIAFHSEYGAESQIVVTNVDGGQRQTVTSGPGLRYYPRWSPDDEWILFAVSEDGQQYDLRAVRVSDGTELVILATPEDEREGDWLPPY